jgi:hypothetical protein
MMAPWSWHCTGGKMEIMPDRSMEINSIDEEPYHITHYLHLMLLRESCLL